MKALIARILVSAFLAGSCAAAGLDWPPLHQQLVEEGRFHVETY